MLLYETKYVPAKYNNLAPDGSEIRLLHSMNGGGLVHCTLPVGGVSKPVYHLSTEEIWFFLAGQGQVWRKQDEQEDVVDVYQGVSLTIPTGTHFQFRTVGESPLEFLIAGMPPWPGPQEAVLLDAGKWDVP